MNDIVEVKEVCHPDEANKLLAQGWVLLSSGCYQSGEVKYDFNSVYILGRPTPSYIHHRPIEYMPTKEDWDELAKEERQW